MANNISRRSFLRYSAFAGGAILTANSAGGILPHFIMRSDGGGAADLAAVSGTNYYDATVRAIELMGGIQRFVPRGARVGLLVNSRYTKPGTYVKPQIALAVIALCRQAGASQIVSLEDTPRRYWRRATLSHEEQVYVTEIKSPHAHRSVLIPEGKNIRMVNVVPDLLDSDVYINISIFKDHEGIRFTGTLKNLMGAISDRSNQTFHMGDDPTADRDEYAYLSQSIAEANLLRRPNLSVGDATEVLVQGGPFGPGPVRNFHTVVVSTDPVALDSCGATIMGFQPANVRMLRLAENLGVGTTNLDSLTVFRESL